MTGAAWFDGGCDDKLEYDENMMKVYVFIMFHHIVFCFKKYNMNNICSSYCYKKCKRKEYPTPYLGASYCREVELNHMKMPNTMHNRVNNAHTY